MPFTPPGEPAQLGLTFFDEGGRFPVSRKRAIIVIDETTEITLEDMRRLGLMLAEWRDQRQPDLSHRDLGDENDHHER